MAAAVRKSVIVTGIGRAVAPRLARLGRGVVRNCTRSADEMNEIENLRREVGGDPVVVKGDVSEDAVRRALAAAAGERRGRLGRAREQRRRHERSRNRSDDDPPEKTRKSVTGRARENDGRRLVPPTPRSRSGRTSNPSRRSGIGPALSPPCR